MKGLTARVGTEWVSFTPLAEHTLIRARQVAFGDDGPYAAAAIGVYGSGKSTLLFALLREALARGQAPIWDEAAAFIERVLPGDEPVLPQVFVARVRDWVDRVRREPAERDLYLAELGRRGRDDVASLLRTGGGPDAPVVLLLDEVEQAHQTLLRRIATDDGQPLRALIDACGPTLRLVLAYAPESYHAVGDADRGRLVTLSVPSIDVAAIRTNFGLPRGYANFAWWVRRGRARGVEQAVRSVIEPLRSGLFDVELAALGDAIDALPGVFGVPALIRDGLDHERLRALADLRPVPCANPVGGVVCHLDDRRGLADRIRHELARRLGERGDLEPVANELVAVLEATADEEDRAYLTLEDFSAALRVAEARAVESGRQREPIERLAEVGARIFDALGDMGPLHRRLPFSLRELCDERFPSPFTDPFLPLADGHVPTEAELDRRFGEMAAQPGPSLVSASGGFVVFADADRLARWVAGGALDAALDPVRALLLDGSRPTAPILELAQFAGRLATVSLGRFHATFVKCLALRSHGSGFGDRLDEFLEHIHADRPLARKIAWHRDRVAVQVRDVRPRPDPTWQAAVAYIRQQESFRGTLARLDRDSPALLGLLFVLRPLGPAERSVCSRTATLFAEGSPLRRLAREANPGGRLSGAAVVIDGLLPAGGRAQRWTEQPSTATRDFASVLDRFAAIADLRPVLAAWLYPEDRDRLAALLHYHGGALPDVDRELDALDALRRLDDTALRARAVVGDLERCTGRRQPALTALKVGNFTDHVRQQAGPVEQLRTLAADVRALPPDGPTAWVRALVLWICGVMAARLLKGVEKEQAALGEWERIATSGADLGRQADELQRALAAICAHRCVDLLRHRRAQIANRLEAIASAVTALAELRAGVTALTLLVPALEEAREALRERGITIDEALEAWLPDLDTASEQLGLLRRVPDLLAELGDEAPRPGDRGVGEYLDLLRRHAETTRRSRLRMRLEDLFASDFDRELRVDAVEIDAIEAAWQRIPDATRTVLRGAVQGANVRGSDEIQRWIVDCANKLDIVAGWSPAAHPLLDGIDTRVSRWSLGLGVTPDDVREATRTRIRALGAVQNLRSGLLSAGVVDHIFDAAATAEGARAYAAIAETARALDERMTELRELHARIAGTYPAGPLTADTPADAIAALEALCAARRKDVEREIARIREVAALQAELGAKGASIPTDLSLAGAVRLFERETARLRDELARQQADLEARLRSIALPVTLAPVPDADVAVWHVRLRAASQHTAQIEAEVATATRLGLPPEPCTVADGPAMAAQLQARNLRALADLQRLSAQFEDLAERCQRLGGPDRPNLILTLGLQDAGRAVEATSRELGQLRNGRLAAATDAARDVYAAVLAGGGAALPAPVAELVALGLLRSIEEAR